MWDLIQALFPLILIIVLLFLALRFVKKYGLKLSGVKTKNIQVKVLGTQMLMPKKYVSIIKFQDKIFLLGVGESISLIKEINASELGEEETKQIIDLSDNNDNFLDTIKKNLGLR